MKIRIIDSAHPGHSVSAKYSSGSLELAALEGGRAYYIVAVGNGPRVQLSRDFPTYADARSAWEKGFTVAREGEQLAALLVAEGIAQAVS